MICVSTSDVTALMPSTQSVPRGTVPGSSRTGACAGDESQRRLDHRIGVRTLDSAIRSRNASKSSGLRNTVDRASPD